MSLRCLRLRMLLMPNVILREVRLECKKVILKLGEKEILNGLTSNGRTMKKYIYIAMAAAAMLGCSKNEVPSIDEDKKDIDENYVIYLDDLTKTVTDDSFNVKWTTDDNLAVYTWPENTVLPTDNALWQKANPVNFVAATGSQSSMAFCLSNGDDFYSLAVKGGYEYADRLNAFKSRYGDGTSNLKWGVIYPGRQSMPSKAGMGVVRFGNREYIKTIQNGINSKDHLYLQDVLWGTATAVSPTIKMSHLGTMMVYSIENETASNLVVKSIKISVPATIGGDFRVKVFDGTIDSCLDGTAQTECALYVENGTIAPGTTAKFYQVLAPFDLKADDTMTITVTTDKGDEVRTKTLTQAVSYEKGKTNTAKIRFDVDLKSKTLAEKWFDTAPLGYYLDAVKGVRYDWTSDFKTGETVKDIDIVVYRGGGDAKNKLVIAAPADQTLQEYVDTDIKEWSKKNDTKIKVVDIDFDNVTKYSELKAAYASSTSEETGSLVVEMNQTVIVKTVDGIYGLIKVSGTRYDNGMWGSCILSIKTVE